jgi:hypothetical protein
LSHGGGGGASDTVPMRHHRKRSADLRIGTDRRFPANLAESEFGAPGQCLKMRPGAGPAAFRIGPAD